jgi:hypothetical protein
MIAKYGMARSRANISFNLSAFNDLLVQTTSATLIYHPSFFLILIDADHFGRGKKVGVDLPFEIYGNGCLLCVNSVDR